MVLSSIKSDIALLTRLYNDVSGSPAASVSLPFSAELFGKTMAYCSMLVSDVSPSICVTFALKYGIV